MNFFREIFGRVAKETPVEVESIAPGIVVKEFPIEYKTAVCDHSWGTSIQVYTDHLDLTTYNEFLDSIGCKRSTYREISILDFRICNKCHKIQVKSDYGNLYGPCSWTNSNDILEKLILKYSKVGGLPAPETLADVLYLTRNQEFRKSGKTDNLKRLHCEDGPAVFRPNGVPEYWWHGVSIPSKWIENKNELESSDFINEQNVERRKALMEIIGTEKFISVLQMTKISDILRNNIFYELFEKIDQTFGKIHLVRCTDPPKIPNDFPSIYYLLTPPWISDVWESVAWTFYERADTYNPEVET